MGLGKLKRRRNTPPGYGQSQSRARALRAPWVKEETELMGPIQFPTGKEILIVALLLVAFGAVVGGGCVWLHSVELRRNANEQ